VHKNNTQHSTPCSFIDRLYNFYFINHKTNIVLNVCCFIICIFYIAINVMVLGRNEARSLYEGAILSALISIFFPIIYCISFDHGRIGASLKCER
jgi:hypothetical protein